MGANGGEAIKVLLERMVPELLSGKIHEEVTHAWLSLKEPQWNSSTIYVKINLIYIYRMQNSLYGLITG